MQNKITIFGAIVIFYRSLYSSLIDFLILICYNQIKRGEEYV